MEVPDPDCLAVYLHSLIITTVPIVVNRVVRLATAILIHLSIIKGELLLDWFFDAIYNVATMEINLLSELVFISTEARSII